MLGGINGNQEEEGGKLAVFRSREGPSAAWLCPIGRGSSGPRSVRPRPRIPLDSPPSELLSIALPRLEMELSFEDSSDRLVGTGIL
jgi:hypothetical protein